VEISDCRINRTYEYFLIKQNDLTIQQTSSFDDLYVDGDFSEGIYENLIHDSKYEIVNHVRSVFQHKSFDYVSVDLSGGFDTRLVYAACSILPTSLIHPKILISTRKSSTQNDANVADLVNSVYNYPYFNDQKICKLIKSNSN
jgi:hypothetical protein